MIRKNKENSINILKNLYLFNDNILLYTNYNLNIIIKVKNLKQRQMIQEATQRRGDEKTSNEEERENIGNTDGKEEL